MWLLFFFPREKLLALEEVTPIAYHNWISVGQRQKEKREREWVKPTIDLSVLDRQQLLILRNVM